MQPPSSVKSGQCAFEANLQAVRKPCVLVNIPEHASWSCVRCTLQTWQPLGWEDRREVSPPVLSCEQPRIEPLPVLVQLLSSTTASSVCTASWGPTGKWARASEPMSLACLNWILYFISSLGLCLWDLARVSLKATQKNVWLLLGMVSLGEHVPVVSAICCCRCS